MREHLARRLRELQSQNLERHMTPPAGLDVCSNDYLALGADPVLRQRLIERLHTVPAALGAPASRLLRGTTARHTALEERLARFKGTERALLFPSGYQANLGVLTTLIGPGDRVLSDELNHASLIDGLRLTGARRVIYPHLDADAAAAELARPFADGRTILVTESYFSMDGDIAPLDRYAELCEQHGAELIVDDAHATGVFGERRGAGLVEQLGVEERVLAVVSTLGKAFGLGGAFVAGPAGVIEFLVQRCRPFIFSTAVPPLLVEALDLALDRLTELPQRRWQLAALARRLRDGLARRGLPRPAGEGPIVSVHVGDNARALAVAEAVQAAGFDARAVRPPTVPPGTARLRLSVHADHTEEQLDELAEAVAHAILGAPALEAMP